ncbi:MAG: mechanosensitive ion channel [Bacteroidales bacterium]|jgi:uncharacterized protein YacL|nr:mechanosensitive ion channel [Bacteroidales bacterium]
MDKVNYWSEVLLKSLVALGEQVVSFLPGVISAIILVLLGWLLAKVLSKFVAKVLNLLQFDKFSEKINDQAWMKNATFKVVPSKIIGKFVYWIVLFLFFITASDTLGWDSVSKSFNQLINYLPSLFSAIIIFILGFYFSTIIRDIINKTLSSLQIASAKILAEVAFYLIMLIVATTSLEQAGVSTALLTSNITIIIGALALTIAVSFAISSREIFKNILSSYYGKENFKIGETIKFQDKEGEIIKIDKMHVTLQGENGKWIIPTYRLISEDIEIIEK